MERPRKSSCLPLPDLKHLVGERICTFLDLPSLLTLRLVCKSTKSWVEAPRNLLRIPIRIRHQNHVERLLKTLKTEFTEGTLTSVPFSNFSMSLQLSNLNQVDQDSLSNFISSFSSIIKVLKITSVSGYSIKIKLFLSAQSLEAVHLNDLSLKDVTSDQLSTLQKNFENYSDFRLDELTHATEQDVKQLINLITKGPKSRLTYLRLPLISYEDSNFGRHSPENSGWNSDEDIGADRQINANRRGNKRRDFSRTEIYRPLINFIKRKNNSATKLKFLDVERLFYEADPDSFQELALVCYKNNVQLINVIFPQLFPQRLQMSLEDHANSLKAIVSLKGFQMGKVDFRNLTNLKQLDWPIAMIDKAVGDPVDFQVDPSELILPYLEGLKINIYSAENSLAKYIVKQLFVTTPRVGVKSLEILWNLGRPAGTEFISGVDLSRNFPNVRVLELVNWDGGDQQFQQLFGGMTLLEEVRIKDCRHLGDGAFAGVGNDISPFRKLRNLRKLWIRCYDKRITDLSFEKAFCLLPLTNLTVHCIGLSPITINGLRALNRLPFKNWIQYLRVDTVPDFPYHQVKWVLKRFGNLKKARL